ncbi:hypothetical protein BGX34_008780 [Mortierella sp. NVP85]|nr:hypothetical protein BGX34_008780 [Mortierella sp. NVP85]
MPPIFLNRPVRNNPLQSMEAQSGISSIRKEDMIELGWVIETAVSRAIAKATSGRAASTEKRVPTEIWERIFKHLYLSQLSRVSMVCRTFYDIVGRLPIWPKVYAKIHPNDQNHLAEGIKPVLEKNPNKDFMLRLCAESLRICELCLSVYSGADIPKDRLASLPLPVHVWRVRAFMKKATFQPLPSKRAPTDWMIRLCVGCRRKVFDHSQEAIPKDPRSVLYGSGPYPNGYRGGFLDDGKEALKKARLEYGGDIGVTSSGLPSSNAIKTMEARLEDDSLPRGYPARTVPCVREEIRVESLNDSFRFLYPFYLFDKILYSTNTPLQDNERLPTMTSPAWTLDLSGLSLVIEQAIEVAVAKAVAKAMVDHGKAPDTIAESPSDKVTTPDPEGASSAAVLNQTTGVEKRLPTEVWERVFKYLYPSQLSRISRVCRVFYDIVIDFPIWPEIYAKAHPTGQNHVAGGVKPVLGKNPNRYFMFHVCAESFQICELCFSVHSDPRVSKDRLASLPLPVHVWRVRLAMKKNEAFVPFFINVEPHDWVIRLCLSCRREVFEACPESVPEFKPSVLSRRQLMESYNLVHGDDEGLMLDQRRALVAARRKYGGDIGVQASDAGSVYKAVSNKVAWLNVVCLCLTNVAVDA